MLLAVSTHAAGGQIERRQVPTAVAAAVGDVIVEYDRGQRFESGASGSLWTYEALQSAYASLRTRPVHDRVEFWWSVMMHVPLQNEFERLFLDFVNRHCRAAFDARLRHFITESRKVGADGAEQIRARHVLGELARMKTK